MSCNKIKQTCGTPTFAVCVRYEGSVSEHTLLTQTECLDTQEVIEDVYRLIGTIKEEIDVTTLENTCITFTTPKSPSSVISQMYNKLCELENLIESQASTIATMESQISLLQSQTCP